MSRSGAIERAVLPPVVVALVTPRAGRLARRAGWLANDTGTLLELGLGVALVALVLPALLRGRRALAGIVVGGVLAVGAAIASDYAGARAYP